MGVVLTVGLEETVKTRPRDYDHLGILRRKVGFSLGTVTRVRTTSQGPSNLAKSIPCIILYTSQGTLKP